MRLINTRTLELRQFNENNRPRYAILSHRWWDREEVTLQQWNEAKTYSSRRGYRKIHDFCRKARSDGFEWAWADTCCIDKVSTENELSEAINSMFKWYQDAGRCYIYLSDVIYDRVDHESRRSVDHMGSILRESLWFTRGWTLQELIAPKDGVFFDANWKRIGTKSSLAFVLSDITRINIDLLRNKRDLSFFSIAQKMSWAAFRKTTRTEDRAYSLCGLFDIKLPTIYGEGDEAFRRLQEMLMARSTDQSLFAWISCEVSAATRLLAPSPDCFYRSSNIVPYSSREWHYFWDGYQDLCRSRFMPKKSRTVDGKTIMEAEEHCCKSGLPDPGPYGTNNMGFQISWLTMSLQTSDRGETRRLHEAALYCYDRSRPGHRPCTIILDLRASGSRREYPHYLGRVPRLSHDLEHPHWVISALSVPVPWIWGPPLSREQKAPFYVIQHSENQGAEAREHIRRMRASIREDANWKRDQRKAYERRKDELKTNVFRGALLATGLMAIQKFIPGLSGSSARKSDRRRGRSGSDTSSSYFASDYGNPDATYRYRPRSR